MNIRASLPVHCLRRNYFSDGRVHDHVTATQNSHCKQWSARSSRECMKYPGKFSTLSGLDLVGRYLNNCGLFRGR